MNATATTTVPSTDNFDKLMSIFALPDKKLVVDPIIGRCTAMLFQLGVPTRLKGFRYIKSAIRMAYDNEDEYSECLTKRLYPDIAKEYGTTWMRVERAMRNAVLQIDRNNAMYINIFGGKEKCTNKEFILGVVGYMKLCEMLQE